MLQKHCFHWGQVNSQEKLLVLERDQKRDQAKSKALEILSPKFCRYLSTSKIIRANPHPRRPRGIQSGREKSAGRSFQVRAEEPLGTDSHRTISKNSSTCRLLIGHAIHALYYCAQSANSFS